MGIPKALLEYDPHQSFLRRLAWAFESSGCQVIAVVGKDAKAIRRLHSDLELVDNERWREGQLSSARVGIRRALAAGAEVVLVHPVDTPQIRPETVRVLLQTLGSGEALVPIHGGKPGHPLILSRQAAREALDAEGASLEAVVATLRLSRVETQDAGVATGVNQPEDYVRAFGHPPRRIPDKAPRPNRAS